VATNTAPRQIIVINATSDPTNIGAWWDAADGWTAGP
jgi:hypothetical protein